MELVSVPDRNRPCLKGTAKPFCACVVSLEFLGFFFVSYHFKPRFNAVLEQNGKWDSFHRCFGEIFEKEIYREYHQT